jgi:hypothetical protein
MALKIAARLAGSSVNPCCCGTAITLVCRSKSFDACLCGFPPFDDDDDLTRWRKKTINGTIELSVFNNAGCEVGSDSGGGPLKTGNGDQYSGEVGWERIDDWTLKVSCVSEGVGPDQTHYRVRANFSANNQGAYNSTPWLWADEYSIVDLHGWSNVMPLQLNAERDLYGGPSADVVAATVNYRVSQTVDDWALTQEYVQTPHEGAVTTCDLEESGTATRTINGVSQGAPSIDDYATWPVNITTYTNERTTAGNEGCPQTGTNPARYSKCTGTITEALPVQDTLDDAESRALAGISDWAVTPSGCIYHTAFRTAKSLQAGSPCFSGRRGQTKGLFTAIIGKNYNITINLVRRALGSSGPFAAFQQLTALVTADQVNEETEWLDVPDEADWETYAINGYIQEVS